MAEKEQSIMWNQPHAGQQELPADMREGRQQAPADRAEAAPRQANRHAENEQAE